MRCLTSVYIETLIMHQLRFTTWISTLVSASDLCLLSNDQYDSRSPILPPSLSLPRCGWMAFALPWPVPSMCLFSGLSDRRNILHGGVASLSRIFSCLWSGWLLEEYLRVCQNMTFLHWTLLHNYSRSCKVVHKSWFIAGLRWSSIASWPACPEWSTII